MLTKFLKSLTIGGQMEIEHSNGSKNKKVGCGLGLSCPEYKVIIGPIQQNNSNSYCL